MVKKNETKKQTKVSISKPVKKQFDTGFLGLMILFVGFSSYAIASFFTSTNSQVKYMYSSVLDNQNESGYEQALPPGEPLFTDVDSNHKNYTAIKRLNDLGVVGGYSDNTFKPDKAINRAEMLAVLTNSVDADFSKGVYKNCFKDVKDDWYSVFVCYAKDATWVSGFEDGNFRPMDPAEKAESLVAVLRAFNYAVCENPSDGSFSDVPADSWIAPYACVAKRDYLFSEEDVFFPNYQLTRADLAQLIYNVMSKKGLL